MLIVKELVLNVVESLLQYVIHLVHLSAVHDLGDFEVLLDLEGLVELDCVLFGDHIGDFGTIDSIDSICTYFMRASYSSLLAFPLLKSKSATRG